MEFVTLVIKADYCLKAVILNFSAAFIENKSFQQLFCYLSYEVVHTETKKNKGNCVRVTNCFYCSGT